MAKKYGLKIEIAGEYGMWARPDSGSDAISYPIPTITACKSILTSICRVRNCDLEIHGIGLCSRPQLIDFSFNSFATTRKSDLKVKGRACQVKNTVLYNPRVQIFATVIRSKENVPNEQYLAVNSPHSFQSQFFRRLKKNQNLFQTSLGSREFIASFVGLPCTPIIKHTEAVFGYLTDIVCGKERSETTGIFTPRIIIKDGFVNVGTEEIRCNQNGLLEFCNEEIESQMNKEIANV